MLANYHTHTPRCHHASGSEREYIEKAIHEGVKVLGFSDHAPYLFNGDYYSTFRMRPHEFDEYMQTIRNLAREYASQLTILAGVEIEYYPGIFERTVKFLGDYDCDYLLLGQHFVGIEEKGSPTPDDRQVFDRYIKQTIEAMETGLFTYFCHPDLCRYEPDMRHTEKGYVQLCEAAKRLNVPLEINMLGLYEGRHYPRELLFRIAAEIGNEVVLGCDAHQVYRMADPQEIANAEAFADRCGITISELTPERVLSRKANIR